MEAAERPAVADGLLERERELAALDRLIDDAADGRGRLALIEGPAGIGKSRLLAEARERGSDGMTVLAARCSELERDFSFGAVRQLFEQIARTDRKRLLAGAAAPAAGVLEETGDAEGSFAALHGLYWATLNLAEERPVLLAIDDLQWSDRPSLRFVAYLARRLEGAPVLIAATRRSTDPGSDATLLAEIAADPLSEAIRPAPLGSEAVNELVRERLGTAPDPRFVAACQEATGGNPLLLRELLKALEEDGVRPGPEGAAAVRDIGPRAVSRTVLLRLSRLPPEAVEVARAVAVLGESSALPVVAALTGLDEPRVARAAGELGRADILGTRPPLGFVHPLVRDAVYGDLPPAERELLHGGAAAALVAAHASDEQVAAQLLHAPPRGDADTVELLRGAARRAARRGGPEGAVAYLARALAEPPVPELRGEVLLELGEAESEMSAPSAVEHLQGAYDRLEDPAARAGAAMALTAPLLFIGRAAEGGALAQRTAAELPPELSDQRQALECLDLIAVFFGGHDPAALDRIDGYLAARDQGGVGARMLTAAAAFALAAQGEPAERCEALALESLAGGELLAHGGGLAWSAALAALILSDSERTPEFLEAAREAAYRRGTVFTLSSAEMFSGTYLLGAGDLEGAEESLRLAVGFQEPYGSDPTSSSWSRGLLGAALAARGDADGARAALGFPPAPEDESDGANLWRRGRAELLLAEGSGEEALELADLMGQAAPWAVHPEWKPWQSLRARALELLGRHDEALDAMAAELELARRCGTASAIGRCLRQLGELEGEDGLERVTEAVELLARSPARLEHARALAALGGALRRARKPSEAREPLRHALELAEACACSPLVEHARSELYATGARPRSTALRGVESLTARELRVARLAAEGRSNRDIAQALFVTSKTVEVHLSNSYRKLDISSRRELPGALAAA